jgi:proline racemase
MSARLALMHAKGQIEVGETLTQQSIIGTEFAGHVIEQVTISAYEGIVPEITGRAFVTSVNCYFTDHNDNLRDGFVI